MNDKVKVALITGCFGIAAAAVTGIFGYITGANNSNVAANSTHLNVTGNGENVSVKPEEYETMYAELEAENARLTSRMESLAQEKEELLQRMEQDTSSPEDEPGANGRDESFSMAGKQYVNGMVWSSRITENSLSLYTLDGVFTEINGILGHVDGTDMNGRTLAIYDDGELHREVPLSGDMMAQPFSLDVTGVQQLKIFILNGHGSPQYGYADVTIR